MKHSVNSVIDHIDQSSREILKCNTQHSTVA